MATRARALTVRIDERLIRQAKDHAKDTGTKMYALVEAALRTALPARKVK